MITPEKNHKIIFFFWKKNEAQISGFTVAKNTPTP